MSIDIVESDFYPVLFDSITAEAIRKSALLTESSVAWMLSVGDAYVLQLERNKISCVLPLQCLLKEVALPRTGCWM